MVKGMSAENTQTTKATENKETEGEKETISFLIPASSAIEKPSLRVSETVITHENTSLETIETISKVTESSKLPSLSLGIRMESSRLELLHNLVGELVTQDNRFLLQNQQNRETLTYFNSVV